MRPLPTVIPKPREPNGRHKRLTHAEKEAEAAYPPAAIKRLASEAVRDARSEFWGSALGQAHLRGEVSEQHVWAGKLWREAQAAYGQAINSPSPHPKPVNFERVGGSAPDPDSDLGRLLSEAEKRAVRKYRGMYIALHDCGRDIEQATRHLIEAECIISLSPIERKNASLGLSKLYEYLTRGRSRVNMQRGKNR